MRNIRWIYIIPIIFLAIIGLVVITHQGETTKVLCEPTTTPWNIENWPYPQEYYAGFYPNITIAQVCTFKGQVTRDQLYKQKVAQGLVFYLSPSGFGGWSIGTTNEKDETSEMNLCLPVTIPNHGWTQLDIRGVDFIEKQNLVGETIIGSKENPVSQREFNFIFSIDDYKKIEKYYDCWRYAMGCPDNWGGTNKTPRSRGILNITKVQLGNLASKDQIWIESMDFEVEIYLPVK